MERDGMGRRPRLGYVGGRAVLMMGGRAVLMMGGRAVLMMGGRAVLVAGCCTGLLAGCCTGLLAGCSATKATPGSGAVGVVGPGATCGTTRTAANVPVIIKVTKGTVVCGTAMHVEDEYAAKIRAGQVQGNGGGAPVTVSGWTCQGYATPEVLRTGNASQCHTSSAAILAVLPVPTPTTTAA